jgi:hypothetical protein
MGRLGRRRPSPAIVISLAALVVAASGTALAADRLVSGDSLIRKRSLSGDRLRNDTLTGQEIKLSSLGQVPSARTAGVANALGGHAASAFESSSNFTRTGLVTAGGGQTVKLAGFGPFTVNLKCNDDGGGTFDAEIDVTSSAANSEVSGTALTAGTSQQIGDAGPDSVFSENTGGSLADFVAAPDVYMAYLIDAVFMPGTTSDCAASLLVIKS